jgi:CDP-2,3-bis-(O-geranylgeranyl)-sn-glycerol synthase
VPDGLLLFLPVLGAPLLHAPVLALDLLRALRRPLDGGRTFRGRRLLGDNKTWRGALVMVCGPLLATLVLSRWPAWWDALPAEVRDAGPALVGVLVGLGVVLGELPNSFLKRQIGIAPGTQRRSTAGLALTVLDQVDFVPAVALLLLPVWAMPLWQLALALLVVGALHVLVNVLGYAIGARTAPV